MKTSTGKYPRLLSTALALCTCLSLFVGCGSQATVLPTPPASPDISSDSPASATGTTDDSSAMQLVATASATDNTAIANTLRKQGIIKTIQTFDFYSDGSCLRTCISEFATADEAETFSVSSLAVELSNSFTVTENTVTYITKTYHYPFDIYSQKSNLEAEGYVVEISN